jgi:hypothetical protein
LRLGKLRRLDALLPGKGSTGRCGGLRLLGLSTFVLRALATAHDHGERQQRRRHP